MMPYVSLSVRWDAALIRGFRLQNAVLHECHELES